jgi:hypothetical protein
MTLDNTLRERIYGTPLDLSINQKRGAMGLFYSLSWANSVLLISKQPASPPSNKAGPKGLFLA